MLSEHPLAIQLENCHSVEFIVALLQDQARTLGSDRIIKPIEGTVPVLCRLSATAALGGVIGPVR